MSNALVPTTLETWQTIQSIAPIAAAARMFGVTQEQAAIVMLKGHELGLGLAAAFEFIHVIDGKPSIAPKGALAIMHMSGAVEMRLTRLTDPKGNFTGYECHMKRKDTNFEHTTRFTLEDAKRAYLTEGSPTSSGKRGYGNWEKYPENMCQWRAIGFAADVVCPDLLGGMIRPEEYGAVVDQDGAPIVAVKITDVTPRVPPQTPPVAPRAQTSPSAPQSTKAPADIVPIPAEKVWTLSDLPALIQQFGAEAIVGANFGNIPQSDAQVQAVAKLLNGVEAYAKAEAEGEIAAIEEVAK